MSIESSTTRAITERVMGNVAAPAASDVGPTGGAS